MCKTNFVGQFTCTQHECCTVTIQRTVQCCRTCLFSLVWQPYIIFLNLWELFYCQPNTCTSDSLSAMASSLMVGSLCGCSTEDFYLFSLIDACSNINQWFHSFPLSLLSWQGRKVRFPNLEVKTAIVYVACVIAMQRTVHVPGLGVLQLSFMCHL